MPRILHVNGSNYELPGDTASTSADGVVDMILEGPAEPIKLLLSDSPDDTGSNFVYIWPRKVWSVGTWVETERTSGTDPAD
jgi:hypothetical protein